MHNLMMNHKRALGTRLYAQMEKDPSEMVSMDLSRDSIFSDQALKLLKDYYMHSNENSPQESFRRAALVYCNGDYAFAQRIYEYVSKGWFMFASPVLSNAPEVGCEEWKGLPISCFLTYVPDDLHGLIDHSSELRWLSVKGGGVGGHWSDVRAVSSKAPGPMPFLQTVDADMTAYRQGTTRKGSYAAYMDVRHPDIVEFVNFRVPTGGDSMRKCFNLHNAVNITDAFMHAVYEDQQWDLIDPHDKSIRETVSARGLWEKIIETRFRTGEPYLNFIDEANRHLPETQKQMGLKIHGSNLCNEVHLATDKDRTAVCCLSSVNLEYFDEWKTTNMIQDCIRLLDNVLQKFIDNCPDDLHKARYSAMQERSIGLGAMGFHSYLQRKGIPFCSGIASSINRKIFSYIKKEAEAASCKLASLYGEAPDMIGTGRRNAHLLAVAPNANSATLLGCSPSIEPWKSNAFTHRTRAGSHLIKNKYLQDLLVSKQKNTDDVWQSIILHQGSVQHLDFLTQDEKDVFKTAFELDQHWIVEHAAVRQQFICQGQSVNLFFPHGSDRSYVNSVHIAAWKKHLKGLYYLRSSSGKVADKVSEPIHIKGKATEVEECLSCSG
jgi:ribonucleoside-diphosphate reductase alpha chain